MSDPRILLCGRGMNEAESGRSLEMLRSVTLPNTIKYLVTVGKFNAGKSAKTFNIESGYPRELAQLQTTAIWAEVPLHEDDRLRDGWDLFGLKGVLTKCEPCDYAVLLRDAVGFQDLWPGLLTDISGRPFLARGSNVLFNLQHERMPSLLDFAWELYITGSIYGISPYSFKAALMTASDSQGFERELGSQSQPLFS